MENMKNKNTFLISCVFCIMFLLLMCYFGINSNLALKGTSAANSCPTDTTEVDGSCCPNGYTSGVETVNGKTYCYNDSFYSAAAGAYCETTIYAAQYSTYIANGWSCQSSSSASSGATIYSCTTNDITKCAVDAVDVVETYEPACYKCPPANATYGGINFTYKWIDDPESYVQNGGSMSGCTLYESATDSSSCVADNKCMYCGAGTNSDVIYWGNSTDETYCVVLEGVAYNDCNEEYLSTGIATAGSCNTLTYNGNSQTLVNVSTGTNVSYEGNSGRNAGQYKVTVKANDGYRFEDGTTETTLSCTISKKSLTVTAKAQTITVGNSISESTSYITSDGLISGHSITSIDLTPSRTTVGTGTITPKNAIVSDTSDDVTENYNITYKSGTLTINAVADTGDDDPVTYTVSYNANGGSGAPSSQTKTHGVDLTLSTTKPTRTNYTFAGWNTNADGSGTDYASGAKYTGNAALTLYAQWTANQTTPTTPTEKTFKATFDANGGTLKGDSSKTCKTTSDSCSITGLPTATKDGYTFKGWGTSSSCTSGNTSSITLTKNTKYFACYTKDEPVDEPNDEENVTVNPGTGEIVIALVWFMGLFAIAYSVYYFRKIKEN